MCARFRFEIEVVVGGTHLESNFVASDETSMCMSTASWSPQFGRGLMHLIFSPYVWLSV